MHIFNAAKQRLPFCMKCEWLVDSRDDRKTQKETKKKRDLTRTQTHTNIEMRTDKFLWISLPLMNVRELKFGRKLDISNCTENEFVPNERRENVRNRERLWSKITYNDSLSNALTRIHSISTIQPTYTP